MAFAYEWFRFERLMVAARCLGAAERLTGEMTAFAATRRAGGGPIADHGLVAGMLADSLTELFAARAMAYETARGIDRGQASPASAGGQASPASAGGQASPAAAGGQASPAAAGGQASKVSHAQCSMAKLYCSEMAGRVADRAVQVFGGRGYMRENVAERFYRELRVERIWEGTSEIQRMIIARQMVKRTPALLV
jgi:alkylation response protein AidB-like acyl-CoA dehydrogenase